MYERTRPLSPREAILEAPYDFFGDSARVGRSLGYSPLRHKVLAVQGYLGEVYANWTRLLTNNEVQLGPDWWHEARRRYPNRPRFHLVISDLNVKGHPGCPKLRFLAELHIDIGPHEADRGTIMVEACKNELERIEVKLEGECLYEEVADNLALRQA